MLASLILGLFLFSPQEIKQQTQRHVLALHSMTMVETQGKHSYEVAVWKKTARPVAPGRPYVDDAWYSLLRDSQGWNLIEQGNRFIYSAECAWQEDYLQIVPCEGEIYTVESDVVRITQRLHTRKWGIVTLDLKYGWVELSEKRLIPRSLTLGWRDKTITAIWSGYQEYRATEPRISEVEADDDLHGMQGGKAGSDTDLYRPSPANEGRATGVGTPNSLRRDSSPSVQGLDANVSGTGHPRSAGRLVCDDVSDTERVGTACVGRWMVDAPSDSPMEESKNAALSLLAPPENGAVREVKVSRPWWKRFLIVKVR